MTGLRLRGERTRHAWQYLDYDARLSINQPRRYLNVCVKCGMEKDFASRRLSWVVGWRMHRGERWAFTSSYVQTPSCPGRLPTPAEVEAWNARVTELTQTHGNQAQGYAL